MSRLIMDDIDQQILNRIQHHFPVDSRPYRLLGDEVGISEEEAHQRVSRLRETGLIRRLGGVFDSHRLGYVSTLCAVSVPDEKVEQAASLINPLPGVTHHYVRDHSYNLWFTLISPSQEQLDITLSKLGQKLQEEADAGPILNLPSRKTFKIKVQFQV
jgi:siroheme decarboxylase